MTGRALADYGQLLETLEVEGDRLASSARGADLELAVPACPGMRLGETVRHVGSAYRMVVSWLRTGERPTHWQQKPEAGQSVESYLRHGLVELLAELSAHDPEDGCPTWWPTHQRYGFWYRRMAHETTVHRIDVQQAAAGGMIVGSIAEDIAIDGIDEILTLWFTHRLGVLGVPEVRPAKVAVVAGGRRWLTEVTTTGTSAWRTDPTEPEGPSEASVTSVTSVTSDPTGMYLWLWGRWPRPAGDRRQRAVDQLYQLLRVATT